MVIMEKPIKPSLSARTIRVLDPYEELEWDDVGGNKVASGKRTVKSLADILIDLGNPNPSQVYLVSDMYTNWVQYEYEGEDEDDGEFEDCLEVGLATIEFESEKKYRLELEDYEAKMIKYNEYLQVQKANKNKKKVMSAEKKVEKLRAQLEAAQAKLRYTRSNNEDF